MYGNVKKARCSVDCHLHHIVYLKNLGILLCLYYTGILLSLKNYEHGETLDWTGAEPKLQQAVTYTNSAHVNTIEAHTIRCVYVCVCVCVCVCATYGIVV